MLLSELSHPNQLHGLTVSQLEEIACQIRERHLQVVSTSGGHLGPGLGVVELSLNRPVINLWMLAIKHTPIN